MTARQAAAHAGCSSSTLGRYTCDQTLLYALMYGCGATFGKCDPKDKPFYPWKTERRGGLTVRIHDDAPLFSEVET